MVSEKCCYRATGGTHELEKLVHFVYMKYNFGPLLDTKLPSK